MRREIHAAQGGRNGGAESRKFFQGPPERTAVADTSPPDSGMTLYRVFLFFEFRRRSAGKNILRVFGSPCPPC